METNADCCTSGCTEIQETMHAEPADEDQRSRLEALAAELAKLSPEDRERLAAMLNGQAQS
jgi:hypothetical protein